MERAFRYQTGETDEIVEDLRKNGNVEVDVDSEDKIKPFLKDLERYGVYELVGIPGIMKLLAFLRIRFCMQGLCKDRKNKASWTNPYIDFFSEYIERKL